MNELRKYNNDPAALMDIVDSITKKRNDLNYNIDDDTFSKLPSNEVVIKIADHTIDMVIDISKVGKKGKYSYFDFMCMLKFEDNPIAAMYHVIHEFYAEDIPYICVGTDYYKVITHTDRYNVNRRKLKLWKLAEIKPFHGKDVIYKIPKYDDFCLEPNNIDYQPIINNMYNQHSEFSHQPDMYGGNYKWTRKLMQHIFGEQYDQGMIYLQCLYMYPKQSLPILVLVSEERSTGKSTFVDWLSILFGENMVVANPEDIGSSFNSSYSDKNVIAIEESRFDSAQTTEKLKNLATQKKILVNAKHQQPYSLPFFGKLIITSNDEHKFSKVDEKEIRYWVRKVPTLTGKANHDILRDLLEEIPYFLKALLELPKPDFSRSRMVFTEDDIKTDALNIVKKESRSQLEKDVIEILQDIFYQSAELEEIYFIPRDFKDRYYKSDSRISISYLRNVFDTKFHFPKSDKIIRYKILDDGILQAGSSTKAGVPYIVKRDQLDLIRTQIIDATDTEEVDDILF